MASVLEEIVRPLVILRARCCRDWPTLAMTRMGRCGYCGERPAVVGMWDEEAS